MTTNWKKPGTAIAAAAWVAICTYLYLAWPSLASLVEALAPPDSALRVGLPSAAFPAVGAIAVLGLVVKDRWLRAPVALVVDAIVGAPALVLLAVLLEPFFIPIE